MASMVSAPATIPATRAATFTAGFDPADPGTRTWVAARSCRPTRSANVITGINPAHDTRFGSSKPAERLWQDRIYRMSFCLVRRSPQETPSSQVKRTFVRHDPLKTPPSPVDRGSGGQPLHSSDMNAALLVVAGLAKACDGHTIIAGFDLTVEAGPAVALMGPNGALHSRGCSRGLKPPVSRSDLAM